MRSLLTLSLLAAAATALAAMPAAAQSTTRIETRPFYGATVTLESGVRVFRPLPPDEHVIINPEGRTPLSLGFNETNVYERRDIRNYNYNQSDASGPRYTTGGYFGPGFYDYRYGGQWRGRHRDGPRVNGH